MRQIIGKVTAVKKKSFVVDNLYVCLWVGGEPMPPLSVEVVVDCQYVYTNHIGDVMLVDKWRIK